MTETSARSPIDARVGARVRARCRRTENAQRLVNYYKGKSMSRYYSPSEIFHHVVGEQKRWHPGLTFAVTVSVSVALWLGIAAIVWELI